MTSDLAELRQAFHSGKLVRPGEGSPSLVDVARAIGHLNGADVRHSAHSSRVVDLIGEPDHLIFVLADGLGLSTLERLPADSFLRRRLAAEITTVFPSTTSSALTTLATGEWPARHAVTGWWTHLPEIDGPATVLHFTRRSDGVPLEQLGVPPERVFPAPAMAAGQGRDVLALVPEQIAGSVYSTYTFGRDGARGYGRPEEVVKTAVSRVRRSAGRTSTYLYFPHVDAAAHQYGASHDAVGQALGLLDAALGGLGQALGDAARIVVTADHGLLDTRQDAVHPIADEDPLVQAMRTSPSGDSRVLYMHPHDGMEEGVRELFRERFGDRFFLIDADEAEELELFGPGPMSAETRRRIGGLIAVSRGVDVVQYRPYSDPMVGHHSGLTPDEMMIPLIVA